MEGVDNQHGERVYKKILGMERADNPQTLPHAQGSPPPMGFPPALCYQY